MQDEHFDPKGKLPSSFTIARQNDLRQSLPFEDERDFEEAKKGFIAAPLTSKLWQKRAMLPGI